MTSLVCFYPTAMMLEEYLAACPYCGESFTSLIDPGAGDQEYIEDCQICCRPIVFTIELDPLTEQATVNLKTENE